MIKKIFLLSSLMASALTGCYSGSTPAEPGEPVVGEVPNDEGLLGSPVYVDSAEVIIMESYPVQVAVLVKGNLPTPCHELHYQYEIQIFGSENRVDITLYSKADPTALCAQSLEPFEKQISLGLEGAVEGTYMVYVNGELAGEFNYPG